MSKHFIGIDLSLNGTAIVVIDEKAKIITQLRFKTKPTDLIEDRLLFISGKILEVLRNDQNIERLYIEGLSFSSSGQSTMELAGLHYVARCFIFQLNGLIYKMISPPSLKKFVSGVGNCKKNLMLLYAFKKFGETFDDDNILICPPRLAQKNTKEDYHKLIHKLLKERKNNDF